MSDETLFYIFGIGLAVSALLISFVGLRIKSFPAKGVPIVVLWFAVLAIAGSTFVVQHSRHEHQAHAAEDEHANEEIERAEEEGVSDEHHESEEPADEADGGEEAGGGQSGASGEAGGTATTLQLAADPAAIAYDTDSLEAEAGEVTIDFTNPAALEHDVVVEQDGKELAKTEIITEGESSLTAELEAGEYIFFCSVPGHREAGMEGTLTVR